MDSHYLQTDNYHVFCDVASALRESRAESTEFTYQSFSLMVIDAQQLELKVKDSRVDSDIYRAAIQLAAKAIRLATEGVGGYLYNPIEGYKKFR